MRAETWVIYYKTFKTNHTMVPIIVIALTLIKQGFFLIMVFHV